MSIHRLWRSALKRYLSVMLQPERVGCVVVTLLCGISIIVSLDREILPSVVNRKKGLYHRLCLLSTSDRTSVYLPKAVFKSARA